MEKVKKAAKKWLCISIALMLLSAIAVSFIQTDGGKVSMKDLKICLLYTSRVKWRRTHEQDHRRTAEDRLGL